MGYSLDLFLDPTGIDDEFLCSICKEVLEDPLMIQDCQHIFCTSCIQNWIRSNSTSISTSSTTSTPSSTSTCPVDRSPFDSSTALTPPIRAYMNMYNRLRLTCSFVGCGAVSNLGDVTSHTANCTFNPDAIKPCVANCGACIKMKDLPAHNCIQYLKGQLELKNLEIVEQKRQFVAMQTRMEVQMARCRALHVQALAAKDKEIKQWQVNLEKANKDFVARLASKDKEIEELKSYPWL